MSLLLDALKKSEAQRRRGTSPTIDLTRTAPSGNPRRPGSRWLFVLLAVILLAAAAPWLWPQVSDWIEKKGGSGSPGTQVEGARSVASGAESKSASASGNQAATPAQTAPPAPVAGAASARRVAGVDASPPEMAGTERGASGESAGEASGDPGVESGATDEGPVSAAAAESETASTASASDTDTSVQGMRRMVQARRREAMASEEQPEPQPATAPSRQVNGPSENFIRPWELPQAQRAEFPELTLTVHFYAERAADRFVLINGERYTEGQRVGPGARLAEIRQRGAVVEFGSYRVLIE